MNIVVSFGRSSCWMYCAVLLFCLVSAFWKPNSENTLNAFACCTRTTQTPESFGRDNAKHSNIASDNCCHLMDVAQFAEFDVLLLFLHSCVMVFSLQTFHLNSTWGKACGDLAVCSGQGSRQAEISLYLLPLPHLYKKAKVRKHTSTYSGLWMLQVKWMNCRRWRCSCLDRRLDTTATRQFQSSLQQDKSTMQTKRHIRIATVLCGWLGKSFSQLSDTNHHTDQQKRTVLPRPHSRAHVLSLQGRAHWKTMWYCLALHTTWHFFFFFSEIDQCGAS